MLMIPAAKKARRANTATDPEPRHAARLFDSSLGQAAAKNAALHNNTRKSGAKVLFAYRDEVLYLRSGWVLLSPTPTPV